MNLRPLFVLACMLGSLLRASDEIALLRPGEGLTYRVGWGMLGQAGELKIEAKEASAGNNARVQVDTTTATRGFVRMLYSFDGDASMLFDAEKGTLLTAVAKTRSRKGRTDASITFDYTKREARYTDHVTPKRSADVPIPPGMPMDMITALIQTRVWNMRPGDTRDVLVLFDKEFYPLRITAEREETISTPDGPRKTLLLTPRMPENPKGMFRRGGEVHVWVSTDGHRLPLRFEVRLKVGTAYAVLTEHREPAPGLR